VFLGRTRGGRTVSVKAIRPEYAQDPEFRRRFRQEVEAVRAVEGRFTSAVVDADPDAAMPWLATAYVPGLSLKEVVSGGWVLPERSLKALAAGLAEALLEIQRAGLVHRDLKPSNVICAVDGPRVIDFGISRTVDTALTRTGVLIGSPGFMSPEQALGRPLTPATDVFSLGSVLAYAATGQNPFGEGQDHVMLYRISHVDPALGGVPDSLRPLVTACLAKDPAARPTANEILRRVGAVPGGSWLPADLTTVIARSATEVLDYESLVVLPPRDPDTAFGGTYGDTFTGQRDAPTVVVPPTGPTPTRRIPTERVAAPVPMSDTRRGRRGRGAAVFFAICFAAVIGAAATALLLTRNDNTQSPPSVTGTSSSQQQSSVAETSSASSAVPSASQSTPSTTPTSKATTPSASPTTPSPAASPTASATTSSASPTPSKAPPTTSVAPTTAAPTTTGPATHPPTTAPSTGA
jgi:eukaryotic-like serine/threonine-protein kinase